MLKKVNLFIAALTVNLFSAPSDTSGDYSSIVDKIKSKSAVDSIQIFKPEILAGAKSFIVDEFRSAPVTKKLPDQTSYIKQMSESLSSILRASGYSVVKAGESGAEEALMLKGEFTEIDNKGSVNTLSVHMTIMTGDNLKVAEIIDGTAVYGKYVEPVRQLIDDEASRLGQFLRTVKNDFEASKDNSTKIPDRISCKFINGKKIAFCALYNQKNRGVATIISAELQKKASEDEYKTSKLPYSIDTILQRFDHERTAFARHVNLPDEIAQKSRASGTDFLLLLYDFMDQKPSPEKEHQGAIGFGVNSGRRISAVTFAQYKPDLADINSISSIYCKADLFDLSTNKVVVQNDIWTDDDDDCSGDEVECALQKIALIFGDYNEKKKKIISCWE